MTLCALANSTSSYVLLLPVARAACEGTDEGAVSSETISRRIVSDASPQTNTVVRWGMVCDAQYVVVLIQSNQSHRLSLQAADVFRKVCESDEIEALHLRQISFPLDGLRAFLWALQRKQSMNASASTSKGTSRLALARGFDRLRACHSIDGVLDAEETNDMDPVCPAFEVEMKENDTKSSTVLKTSPSLSLPTLPSLPPAPLVSPGTTSVLKRKRSLRILDFDTLGVESTGFNTTVSKPSVHVESRAATAAISKIRDYLYLGGKAAASLPLCALQERNIVAIVNLAAGVMPNYHRSNGYKPNGNGNTRHDGIEYTRVYARDAENEDGLALVPVVARAVSRARERGGAALIHCHRGVSRSAAMAIAVLMIEEGTNTRDLNWALREVRTARPVISPNVGFVRDLQALDKILQGKEASAKRRITHLARLKDDPGDGEECLVLYNCNNNNFQENHVWDAVVIEDDNDTKGITVARGALVHERKWREAIRQAKWIEHRNTIVAQRSFGRRKPLSFRCVDLDAKLIGVKI